MQTRKLLGSGVTSDGVPLTLHEEGIGFVVRIGNEVLMSSRVHGSESAMAMQGLESALRSPHPRVLIGGLGMGYTLRATLDLLPPRSDVVVAEMFDCVVEWNRGPIAALSDHALSDRRVRLEIQDVQRSIAHHGSGYDAILLDVDNGPDAFVCSGNRTIYSPVGLAAILSALRPGGILAVWSASASKPFEKALARAGFAAETVTLPSRHDSRKGGRFIVFLGRKMTPGKNVRQNARSSVRPTTRSSPRN